MLGARLVLAMSGGVDSSVSAHLLRQAGYDVVGVFMRHGPPVAICASEPERTTGSELPWFDARADHKQGCCSAADAADARAVAQRIGIPFYALDLQDGFGRIMDYFVDEYVVGRTPNPCVVCNTWLKFGTLFDYADSIGARYVATGHYAQVTSDGGSEGPALHRGFDAAKDQSYVLSGVPRERLRRMLLPVGGFRKSAIRELAMSLQLPVAEKPDSQEICFVTTGRHADFVRARKGPRETAGPIVTTSGRIVGWHPGLEGFTVGQRKSLGVALGEPYFVVALDPRTNRVIIGRHEELARRELTAAGCNWLIDPPTAAFDCEVQIRYNSRAVAATVTPLSDARLHVAFKQSCYGVAPGQAAVCYWQDRVLGGGWIESDEVASAVLGDAV